MDEESSKVVVDYSPLMKRSIWSMLIVATIFTALRVYARVTPRVTLWWDDYFLLVSWATLLISTALLTEGVKYGIGMHYEDMEFENLPKVAEFSYSAGFVIILGTAWSKTSFGITLLRISTGWIRGLVWFIIISMNLVLITNSILLWVQCWPTKKLFDPLAEGTCWPREMHERYQTFCAAYSGAGDIVLALLPWKIVWNATLFRREKIGALIAMSMGVFSGIISFLKIISLDEISDVRSTTVDLKIFGLAEVAVTIIAVSIPILRAFIRRGHQSSVVKSSFIYSNEPSTTASSGYRESFKFGVIAKEISVSQTVDSYDRSERKTYSHV